ncbi:MAG: hypothetical protein AAB851_02825 [Patescibacteria group bacterium]
MNFNLKKILIIGGGVFILLAAVFVMYNLFFKAPATPKEIVLEEEIAIKEKKKPAAAQKVAAISSEAVVSPSLSPDGAKIRYYLKSNGNVLESDFNGGGVTRVSSAVLKNLIKVLWSPSRDKVISVFEENGTAKKSYYDYNTGRAASLPDGMKYIVWSKDGKQIAYNYVSGMVGNISVSNPDGSGWKVLQNARIPDLVMYWYQKDKIAFASAPSGLAASTLLSADLTKPGELLALFSDVYGLIANWSPSGNKLIYSATDSDGKNLNLYFKDIITQKANNFGLATIAEKCAWSINDKTIYCAIPDDIPARFVLPDDYYKGYFSVNDKLVKINTDTGEVLEIFPPATGTFVSAGYDITQILLSPSEDYLFFVNRKDGLLYRVKL